MLKKTRRLLLLLVGLALPASAVSIDWVTVGDPGNAADTEIMNDGSTGYGSVGYAYRIAVTETTNGQYAGFLNAVAQTDPYLLYHSFMDRNQGLGEGSGIVRSGSSGSYSYAPETGRDDRPVNYVSIYDAMRFANWLHNGQGGSDTETGAYTLLGGTPVPTNADTVTRNPGVASIFLPTADEWYKAAYYDAVSLSYFDYPAGTNTPTTCAIPGPTPNTASCEGAAGGDFTDAGAYTGSASPYGTFDQGGNLFEWNETITGTPPNTSSFGQPPMLPSDGPFRDLRGGSAYDALAYLAASGRNSNTPDSEFAAQGFRVASVVPEPSTGLLLMTGLLAVAHWRRAKS